MSQSVNLPTMKGVRIFMKYNKSVTFAGGALLLLSLFVPPGRAWAATTPTYANVLVSGVGSTGNTIANGNTSTSVAASPNGIIYVAYHGSNGIRVATSTNNGQSFGASVQVTSANYEPSIAVSSTGTVYVTWSDGTNIWVSQSNDSGQTFSAPVNIGPFGAPSILGVSTVHIATDGQYVYIVPASGTTLYYTGLMQLTPDIACCFGVQTSPTQE